MQYSPLNEIKCSAIFLTRGAHNRIFNSPLQSMEQIIKMNFQILNKVKTLKKNFQKIEIQKDAISLQKLL